MKNKPKILISACLLGENCKYNGGNNADAICAGELAKLRQIYELVAVCPECMGGLTTPREPAEICANGRVITKFSGRDMTAEFVLGAQICAEIASENGCKIAVLKERSPSCGSGEIYDGSFTGRLASGDGITAAALKKLGVRIVGESALAELNLEKKAENGRVDKH
jgi:purine nucleoside phosphorylase